MKVKQVIDKLQTVLEQNGNIEVIFFNERITDEITFFIKHKINTPVLHITSYKNNIFRAAKKPLDEADLNKLIEVAKAKLQALKNK